MDLQFRMVHKLFLAIFGGIAVTLIIMSLLVYWNVTRGFLNYVNKVEADALTDLLEPLQDEYTRQGSWGLLKKEEWRWRKMVQDHYHNQIRQERDRPAPDEARSMRPQSRRGRGARLPREQGKPGRVGPGQRVLLLDAQGKAVFGPRELVKESVRKAIQVEGETVGFLGLVPRKIITSELDQQFLKSQVKVLAWVILLLLGVAMGLSILLARHWGGRLRHLEEGAFALSLGKFETRLQDKGQDELASVARNFNNLALTLGENEKARQRWTADISHELRTPLAIFKGELEALQDGVRTYRPELLASLLSEVSCLTKLVEDLYELARADLGGLGYRKMTTDGLSILKQVTQGFEERIRQAGLTLEASLANGKPQMLFGDPDRLYQLFSNILANSLKYTDPGGVISVTCESTPGFFTVVVEDSYPGLQPDQCEAIFSRFYRGPNEVRSSQMGSGLGLAICRNIVQAHEGTIGAKPSQLGGLAIRISLPLKKG